MNRRPFLSVLARLLPREKRPDWIREWSAELDQARLDRRSRTRIAWWALQDAMVAVWRRVRGDGVPAGEVRSAFRVLRRAPGYAFVVVVTLALGIGANTAVFSVVDALLLRPLPIRAPDLVMVLNKIKDGRRSATSAPNFLAWRERTRSFEGMAAARVASANLLTDADPLRVTRTLVTPGFFSVLGVRPMLGRAFDDGEGVEGRDGVAVLSHELWRNAYGADPAVLGRTLVVNGESKIVVGVLPAGFRVPPLTADVWTPLAFAQDALESWGRNNVLVVARLAADVTPDQARSELATIGEQLAVEQPEANEGWSIGAMRVHDAAVGTDSRRALWLVFGSAGFVLLIACVNVAGLVVARGLQRRRELAVRISLGATRTRLVVQLLGETVMLALLGGALGGLIAGLAIGPVRALVPPRLARVGEILVDGRVFLFALGMAVLTGAVAGLFPALRLSGSRRAATRGGGIGGLLRARGASSRGSTVLVGVQFALATVLLVGAGLTVRSLEALYDVDVGVRHEGAFTFGATFGAADYPETERVVAAVDEVLRRLEGRPDVDAVAATSHLPLSGARLSSSVVWEGGLAEHSVRNPSLGLKVVTPSYFGLLGIPLLSGRGFLPSDDERSEPVVILNRSAAERLWPGEDPVGRWVSWVTDDQGRPVRRRVIGVVEDVRFAGPMSAADLEAYQVHRQTSEVWRWFGRSMTFVARPVAGRTLSAGEARDALRAVDPRIPMVGFWSLTDWLDRSVATPRFHATLISLFATLALALSAVGLYGVTAFNVRRRTRDIGIRMALGAGARSVATGVVIRALRTAALGGVVGLGAAYALGETLSSLLWSVGPRDPSTYVASVAGLVAVGAVAALVPAARAARVDPVRTLGVE